MKNLMLSSIVIAIILAAMFFSGWLVGKNATIKKYESLPPKTVTKIDTMYIASPPVTQIKWKTKTVYLPAADPDNEPMDTIDYPFDVPQDSVAVQIPIDKYVAHKDSLYHIEVTGYDVNFTGITVFPKTIYKENVVEVTKASQWSIGVQAGYGVSYTNNKFGLGPYVGVGLTFNILNW